MLILPEDLTSACIAGFRARHGVDPDRVARASGRVNLIGEHVDFVGGQCLPVSLPYATWVSARLRTDDRVLLSSAGHQPWEGRRTTDGANAPGWCRYVLAALSESEHVGGVELHVESTVPLGAGLSSSAALICAVLRAVDERANTDLVTPAVQAETVGLGLPTGGMDQTISLLASVGHALRLDFSGGRPVAVPWSPGLVGLEVLVVDTGVRHDNSDGAFAGVRALTERALAGEDGDPRLERHRRHVASENRRVGDVVDAVVRGDWRAVGATMTASHASLRDDLGVSCVELDAVVEAALAGGALGARMTGGGFGGCTVTLAPIELRETLVETMESLWAERGFAGRPAVRLGDAEGPATRIR